MPRKVKRQVRKQVRKRTRRTSRLRPWIRKARRGGSYNLNVMADNIRNYLASLKK